MEAVSQLSPMRRLILIGASIGLLAVVFSQLQLYLRRRRFKRQHGCQPVAKSATRDPILGLDLVERQLRSARDHKALEQARQRFLDCGNTFRMNVLGRPGIATIEPDNVKAVLAVNFDDYGVGHRLLTFGPLLGAGIFDTDGKHWAMSRSLIRPNFTREQVADLAAFEKLIHDLLAHIPRDGETTVDLQNLFFRYTIDSATEFLFGHSVGSLREGAATSELSFSEAFNYAQEAIRTRNIMGPLRFLHRDQKADRCNKLCRSFAQQFVDKAVAAVEAEKKAGVQDDKYVFAHELARRTSDKQRILDELMNVLLAGRDTTASLLSNMFFMLAKNPPMWDKLRQEVASLEGRVPTYAELRNLKYLKCCMNESLRLHPVVPMNGRNANRDTVLPVGGGPDGKSPVFVAKGTAVFYNAYAMHRRTDYYGDDAEEFRPERWENGKLQPRWEYLPFNGGPRICIGQQYALTEVAYVTARMAQEFSKLESRDPGPWEEQLTLTVASRNGTKVCLIPAVK